MVAPIDSMENTVELGRIRIRAYENETIRKAFIEVMKMMIADVAKERGLGLADWQVQKPMPPSQVVVSAWARASARSGSPACRPAAVAPAHH